MLITRLGAVASQQPLPILEAEYSAQVGGLSMAALADPVLDATHAAAVDGLSFGAAVDDSAIAMFAASVDGLSFGASGGPVVDASQAATVSGLSFGTEAVTLWTPEQITTALWLDAADSSTIVESGGAVSQWNDKSGNGRNATQSNAAFRPAYTIAGLAGKNVVTFDGSNDFMSGASYMPNSTSNFVLASVHSTRTGMGLDGQGVGWGISFIPTVGSIVTTSPSLAQHNSPFISGFESQAAVRVMPVTQGSGGIIGYSINGSYAENAHNSSLLRGVPDLYQLGRSVTTTTYQAGIIAEYIAIVGTVTTATRQRIEGYLAHKWGLTANLPSDHPYKTNPPTT